MYFPLGNFVQAVVKDKNMYNGNLSINKIILWEKIPATEEPRIPLGLPN